MEELVYNSIIPSGAPVPLKPGRFLSQKELDIVRDCMGQLGSPDEEEWGLLRWVHRKRALPQNPSFYQYDFLSHCIANSSKDPVVYGEAYRSLGEKLSGVNPVAGPTYYD